MPKVWVISTRLTWLKREDELEQASYTKYLGPGIRTLLWLSHLNQDETLHQNHQKNRGNESTTVVLNNFPFQIMMIAVVYLYHIHM